jgi:hypothetical protein
MYNYFNKKITKLMYNNNNNSDSDSNNNNEKKEIPSAPPSAPPYESCEDNIKYYAPSAPSSELCDDDDSYDMLDANILISMPINISELESIPSKKEDSLLPCAELVCETQNAVPIIYATNIEQIPGTGPNPNPEIINEDISKTIITNNDPQVNNGTISTIENVNRILTNRINMLLEDNYSKGSKKGSKRGSRKVSKKGSRKGSRKVSKKGSKKASKKNTKKKSKRGSKKASKKNTKRASKNGSEKY